MLTDGEKSWGGGGHYFDQFFFIEMQPKRSVFIVSSGSLIANMICSFIHYTCQFLKFKSLTEFITQENLQKLGR